MATRSTAIGTARRSRPSRERTGTALRAGHPAVLLAATTLALVLLGLIMILSSSSVSSFATYGSSFWFFKKQVLWAAVGLVCFAVFAGVDYRRLKGFGYVLYALAVALLLAVLVPGVGIVAGGSARWLGAGPLSFQPSELAKLALVLLAADVFSRKHEKTLRQFSHVVLPMIPAVGIMAVLILAQPDLGTTLLVGVIGMGMLFVAGASFRHLIPITAIGLAATSLAALGEDYRRARVLAFLDPWADPLNTGYQTIQSLIALGSGGLFGVGLGASRQKWSYVPNAHTDFIFSILGEETGLLGTLAVVGMFAFLAYLGIRIARNAPDRFGMLLASGITIWIVCQALVNMGAVTAALPITGVPLPLVSFGGSSLVILLIAMGILTNIARQGMYAVPKKGGASSGPERTRGSILPRSQ